MKRIGYFGRHKLTLKESLRYNKMKTLVVYYWKGNQLLDEYEHNEEISYNEVELHILEQECLLNELSYMVVPNGDYITCYIGKGTLTQG